MAETETKATCPECGKAIGEGDTLRAYKELYGGPAWMMRLGHTIQRSIEALKANRLRYPTIYKDVDFGPRQVVTITMSCTTPRRAAGRARGSVPVHVG